MQHLNLGSDYYFTIDIKSYYPIPAQQYSYDTRITCLVVVTSSSGKRKDRFNCHCL